MNQSVKDKLYAEAFKLLQRAQDLLLAARAAHEKRKAEQDKNL